MKSVAVLVCLSLLGCGETSKAPLEAEGGLKPAPTFAPPSVAEARTLIEGSAEFSEYQFTNAAYTLPLVRSAMNEPALEIANQLKAAKWIAFDGDGKVVLTEKAKDDRRFLVRPNGVVDIVPLAKKEFLGVSTVATNAEGAPVVDFRWKWVPNDIGTIFKTGLLQARYSGEQHARATLLRDGDAWTVLRIEPK